MKYLTFILIAMISLSTSSCSKTPDLIKKGEDTFYYGYVIAGKKFDIKIGDNRLDAKRKLLSDNVVYYRHYECEELTHMRVACVKGETYDYYRKHGIIRDGGIYVFFKDDVITGIAWSFNYSIII
jgi:hypothetical protein